MSFALTIIVCSRKELQTKYAEALNARSKRGCNIIGCFSSHDAELADKWRDEYRITSVCFDDVDTTRSLSGYLDEKTNTFSFGLPPKCILFDDRHTQTIIDSMKNTTNLLNWIVFCDVGISRSPAIADFIARVLSKASGDWRIHYGFMLEYAYNVHPNGLVVSTLNKYFTETVEALSNKIEK